MNEAPERIWATVNGASTTIGIGPDGLACPGPRQLIGGWSQHFRHSGQIEYRRADLPPTLAAALALPEIAALVEAGTNALYIIQHDGWGGTAEAIALETALRAEATREG